MTIIDNRYQLQEQLGAGGMGKVYRAVDLNTGDNVAVKVLRSDVLADNPEVLERFEREADALRQLNHPNIVKVLASINEPNRHSIVMEFVSGGALHEELKQKGKLSVRRTMEIALDLADALTRAHRLQIVHRDLKPANILIADDNTTRLTDFGVALMGKRDRVTISGTTVGTPDYMAPEVLNGETGDPRSDIWSFGVMLFEMLTGNRPFNGDSLTQLISNILTGPIPDLESIAPELPIPLVDLVYRMLARDRASRLSSVRLIGVELEALLSGSSGTVISSSVFRPEAGETRPIQQGRFGTITPSTGSGIRSNLPAQATPFVGRETELSEVMRLLADPDRRLVTILGPGGMGKTRLAIRTAEMLLEGYSQGVFFVSLAPLNSPDNIEAAVAEAVGFGFQSDGRTPRQQLLDYLREKRLLLVMDNFEHVLDGASLVDDILRNASEINVLVTSRERLNLSSETLYVLDGMQFPAWQTPEEAMQYSAVQLFLQGAQRARPGFELKPDNLNAVASICQMVQGMPLGILLASTWVETLNVDEIVSEIEESLDFLETEMRDLPERHRSVRAVFEYSWKLMTEAERKVFASLSVFRGGFDRDAARKVAGANLRVLTGLVNKSLLRRDPESGRYAMHVMLRQYAEEQFAFADDIEADIYHRHALYFVEKLSGFIPLFNTLDEKRAYDEIDADIDNIRIAFDWAMKQHAWDLLDQVQDPLLSYFLARSMLYEGVTDFRRLAEALEISGNADSAIYWRARSREAWLSSRMGDYETVWELASAAYEWFFQNGIVTEHAQALNNMSYARMMQGEYEEAKHYAGAALHEARQQHQQFAMFAALGHLGYTEFLQGNYDEALALYTDLMNQSAEARYSATGRAFGLNNLGEINQALGLFDDACDQYEEAYGIFVEFKHRRGMAFTLNNLAGIHSLRGEYTRAGELYRQAYELNKDIGDRSGIAHSLSALGNVASFAGDLGEARVYYQQALQIRRELGERRGIANSYSDLGDTAFAEGNYAEAQSLYEQAYTIQNEIGDQQGMAQSMTWLGILSALRLNDFDVAMDQLDQALRLAEGVQNVFLIAQITAARGEILLRHGDGDVEEAEEKFYAALRLAHTFELTTMMIFSSLGVAAILLRNDPEQALEVVTVIGQQPRVFMNFFMAGMVKELTTELQKLIPSARYDEISRRAQTLSLPVLADRLLADHA